MPLEAKVAEAIALSGAKPPSPTGDPVERRRLALEYEEQIWPFVGLDGPDLRTEERVISTPGFPDATLQLIFPSGHDPAREALPICLSLFGGAWRQGGTHHPMFWHPARRRAESARVIMAGLSYALAPEHLFPAALEQTYAALRWIHRHAAEIGGDPDRLAIEGGSAGGNLAAAATLMNRDGDQIPLQLQILEVPALDLTAQTLDWEAVPEAYRDYAKADVREVFSGYVADPEQLKDPLVSPLRAPSLAGLPPALIITSEVDPLRGDGEAYAAALDAAGVPVSAFRLVNADHGSSVFERVSPGARSAQVLVQSALRSLHD
jgi:acetyl esterase